MPVDFRFTAKANALKHVLSTKPNDARWIKPARSSHSHSTVKDKYSKGRPPTFQLSSLREGWHAGWHVMREEMMFRQHSPRLVRSPSSCLRSQAATALCVVRAARAAAASPSRIGIA
eukprot:676439-Pleurochrysis_carterae.AAC.1